MSAIGDQKSALNQAAQKHCKRPVTKQDIVYTTQKFGKQWQATVTLNFMDGTQYAGDLSDTDKLAGHSAAKQALIAIGAEVAEPGAIPEPAKKKQKVGAVAASSGLGFAEGMEGFPSDPYQMAEWLGMPPPSLAGGEAEASAFMTANAVAAPNPALSAKVDLNSLCMKLARRTLQKGETVYSSEKTAGGYQGLVTLNCLPGEWAGKEWAGEVCSTKALAEQNAAQQAVKTLMEEPEFAALAQQPAASKQKGKGKGKGCKGGWKGGWDGFDGGWGKGGGKWGCKGGGGPMGKGKEREEVTQIATTGEVTAWNGQFGFLQAHAPIDHPKSEMRGGKIFVSARDFAAGCDGGDFAPGKVVSFQVYADSGGLGAAEVSPF